MAKQTKQYDNTNHTGFFAPNANQLAINDDPELLWGYWSLNADKSDSLPVLAKIINGALVIIRSSDGEGLGSLKQHPKGFHGTLKHPVTGEEGRFGGVYQPTKDNGTALNIFPSKSSTLSREATNSAFAKAIASL